MAPHLASTRSVEEVDRPQSPLALAAAVTAAGVEVAMTYEFQVTADCADPHAQADWWAETLGWQVQPQDEALIRRMISGGHATDSDTRVHHGALVWKDGRPSATPRETSSAYRGRRARPGDGIVDVSTMLTSA
jgi:hypothetical protein